MAPVFGDGSRPLVDLGRPPVNLPFSKKGTGADHTEMRAVFKIEPSLPANKHAAYPRIPDEIPQPIESAD